jgi:hypothetical protein
MSKDSNVVICWFFMTLCILCGGGGGGVKFWLFFEPCFNRKFAQEVMGIQSGESPNFENFGTLNLGVPGKISFGCSPHGESQIIL